MLFAEDHARLLLVLHTALAVAAVGASTHLVIWLRRVRRGAHGRLRAVRRFGYYAAALHLAAFVVGNLIYPVYKVRVKASYLQSPAVVTQEAVARGVQANELARRYAADPPGEVDPARLERAAAHLPDATERVARWFDTKEHWVAMGLIVALALAFLLPAWRPEDGAGGEIGGIVYGMAIAAAASLWLGAIVGVIVASWRAVG